MTREDLKLRLPLELKAWLKAQAENNSRTMNGEILQLIKAAKRAEDGEAA